MDRNHILMLIVLAESIGVKSFAVCHPSCVRITIHLSAYVSGAVQHRAMNVILPISPEQMSAIGRNSRCFRFAPIAMKQLRQFREWAFAVLNDIVQGRGPHGSRPSHLNGRTATCPGYRHLNRFNIVKKENPSVSDPAVLCTALQQSIHAASNVDIGFLQSPTLHRSDPCRAIQEKPAIHAAEPEQGEARNSDRHSDTSPPQFLSHILLLTVRSLFPRSCIASTPP